MLNCINVKLKTSHQISFYPICQGHYFYFYQSFFVGVVAG